MQIFGHCRFSWFGISDTGRELTGIEDAHLRLWHPLRMAIRFHLFEHLMLPSLGAQTDQDFTLLVTVSEDMPEVFHLRLERVVVAYPFVRLNRTMSRDYAKLIAPFMRETTADGTIQSAHFRLDDDDAVPSSYIARLKRDADRVDTGGLVCYPSGVVGFLDGQQAKHGFRSISYHAQGLARIAGPGVLRSPLHMQHRDMGNHVPSYVDPTFTGFHFTQHSVNNTLGYGEIVHSGSDRRLVDRMTRNNPDLSTGIVSPPRCDEAIAVAFPFTDGPGIRKMLEATTTPAQLCEEMGFALP
ncbi:glycosyltransferase [Tabrizicola sp. BL-A-41-H6]|uniref:glycosyltransferase n=1 Tax=Tabrizicola sp. BL-A-41-H6 TaxID=3421107 RepID=UPI003D67F28F